jgi:hypothetical protein
MFCIFVSCHCCVCSSPSLDFCLVFCLYFFWLFLIIHVLLKFEKFQTFVLYLIIIYIKHVTQSSRKLKKSVRQTMKICRTETKSVRPNKIKGKLVFVFLRHLSVFNFFAVKIGTVRIAHHLLPVIPQWFTGKSVIILLNLYI